MVTLTFDDASELTVEETTLRKIPYFATQLDFNKSSNTSADILHVADFNAATVKKSLCLVEGDGAGYFSDECDVLDFFGLADYVPDLRMVSHIMDMGRLECAYILCEVSEYKEDLYRQVIKINGDTYIFNGDMIACSRYDKNNLTESLLEGCSVYCDVGRIYDDFDEIKFSYDLDDVLNSGDVANLVPLMKNIKFDPSTGQRDRIRAYDSILYNYDDYSIDFDIDEELDDFQYKYYVCSKI